MTGVVNGTLVDRKINIFSAHDVNVVAILYALGIFNNFFPMFTSGVIIELHEKEGEFYVLVSIRLIVIIVQRLHTSIPSLRRLLMSRVISCHFVCLNKEKQLTN